MSSVEIKKISRGKHFQMQRAVATIYERHVSPVRLLKPSGSSSPITTMLKTILRDHPRGLSPNTRIFLESQTTVLGSLGTSSLDHPPFSTGN